MPYFYVALLFVFAHALPAHNSEGRDQIRIIYPHKEVVHIGVYVTDLRNFDYSKNSFDTIFYAWWNSENKNYRPDKIVEIINSYSYIGKDNFQTSYGKKIYTTSVRYYATVRYDWNMKYFPFDRQILEVYLEDGLSDINSIKFIPNIKNSQISKELDIGGWELQNFSLEESPHTYETNFGNDQVEQAIFSRVTLRFDLKRLGSRDFINYFIGFFMAVFLMGLAYFIDPTNTNQKFSLALSAIFAAMTNKYILDRLLPISSYFTLSDSIQLSSFLFIIIGSTVFTVESILVHQNKISLCQRINYTCYILSSISYLAFIAIAVYTAVSS
jgi:hypothetical protein